MLPKPVMAASIALALMMTACKITSQTVQPSNDAPDNLQVSGEIIYQRTGCAGCHEKGVGVIAPSLIGLYGGIVLLEDGETILADEAYIRESILSPSIRVVRGYKAIMPDFKDQVSDEEVEALIEYIRSLAQGK